MTEIVKSVVKLSLPWFLARCKGYVSESNFMWWEFDAKMLRTNFIR